MDSGGSITYSLTPILIDEVTCESVGGASAINFAQGPRWVLASPGYNV